MESEDQGKAQNVQAEGDSDNNPSPRKPIHEWTAEDFRAIGVDAIDSGKEPYTDKYGVRHTRIQIRVNWGTFKFAK